MRTGLISTERKSAAYMIQNPYDMMLFLIHHRSRHAKRLELFHFFRRAYNNISIRESHLICTNREAVQLLDEEISAIAFEG